MQITFHYDSFQVRSEFILLGIVSKEEYCLKNKITDLTEPAPLLLLWRCCLC